MTEERDATTDPFELWKQWYEQNEKAWGRSVADATGTEAFAEMQGKVLESFLAFQKTVRDASRTQLEALGLPTRDDIARLGEIVLGLEEKIDQIADLIRSSVGQGPPERPQGQGPLSAKRARRRGPSPASLRSAKGPSPRSARPGDGRPRRSSAKRK